MLNDLRLAWSWLSRDQKASILANIRAEHEGCCVERVTAFIAVDPSGEGFLLWMSNTGESELCSSCLHYDMLEDVYLLVDELTLEEYRPLYGSGIVAFEGLYFPPCEALDLPDLSPFVKLGVGTRCEAEVLLVGKLRELSPDDWERLKAMQPLVKCEEDEEKPS